MPIDNEKLIDRMKPVLTPKEIDDIILSIKDEDLIWIDDRKQRIKKFHDILLKRDEKELLMLASCLYLRSTETEERHLINRTGNIKNRRIRHRSGIFICAAPQCAGYRNIYTKKTGYRIIFSILF